MAMEKNCLSNEQKEVIVISKNTHSEVLLHHRLPWKGKENMVMEKNKVHESVMVIKNNTI